MKRVRLTQRTAESQADGLFPGDIGNMERSKAYRDIDHYHKFEQTVNHELPDMRHEWKEDERDENNLPILKVADMYAAAQNAIKLSMMFLGDNASQKMIEAQARDFMKLGNKRLVASLNRWYETEEDFEEVEETEETPVEANEEIEDAVTEETVTEEIEEAPAVAEETPVETEEIEEETFEEADEEIEEVEQEVEAEQEMTLEDETADLNTEVDFDTTEEVVDADEQLESIFDDEVAMEDDENEVINGKQASRKQGIKKIACQPKLVRVASKKSDDLERLWEKLDAPGIN